mmetsp:Transcript_20179/g.77430  ORF Transcript_20179/g.77430 Transcript_20179/m.77430 type:complete len:218 (-) Transcript_20179:633-1286(-)
MKGVIGSLSGAMRRAMRASRIIKLVADESSSIRSRSAPASSDSTMLAACDVLPLASAVEKSAVDRPPGRFWMNAPMSTDDTDRPSSARIFTALDEDATSSRPSPGTWLYTPTCSACSSVLLPWKPPPQMSVTPRGTAMPVTAPAWGRRTVRLSDAGDRNGTAELPSMGASLAPDALGRIAPSRTNAASPAGPSAALRHSWSSALCTCDLSDAASSDA